MSVRRADRAPGLVKGTELLLVQHAGAPGFPITISAPVSNHIGADLTF